MSRNPCAVGLTKTEMLRQAKTAAALKDYDKKREETARHQADPFSRRRRVVRPEPKKVDFRKPGMTKAMMARVKQAEKFKQEYERKQETLSAARKPKRTPAPIGGDARSRRQMGRERVTDRERRRSPSTSRPTTPKATSPARREFEPGPGTSRLPTFKRHPPFLRPGGSSEPTVTRKTNELARMMNADIVQADPIGEGPINNIVIPPGIVSDNRTTIISIQQPSADIEAKSQLANRSIQVISDTLDEQDAVETSAVQGRLTELQQARRDFVMAVANVGANAVNIEEESPPPSFLSPGMSETPQRHLLKVPDLEDEFLQPEYTREHPDVVAAREFMEQRNAARRIEDEFERIAAQEQMADDLQLDVPFEEELYQERDISWEEDESGMAIPRPSRVKAYIPSVPRQARPYEYEPFDPENLERFFDLQRHPPCPQYGPPAGREQINPDLWELDDPWYRPPPEPEGPDLMEFDLMDFD